MGRAPCCDKSNVKKGPWSPEEDATLKDYIEKHGFGGNWIALPQKIGLKRCGKSCRLRWLNYLRPNIKHGGFTEEEDKIICNLYISIGSRWSVIAAQLPGRTDNDIKNYWNTRLKKRMFGKRKQTFLDQLSIAQGYQNLQNDGNNNALGDYSSPFLQNLSNSAIERLQLHMHLQSTSSFLNNPTLFPKLKLNPLQEKMVQNIHSMTNDQKFETFHQQSCESISRNNMKFDHAVEDMNELSSDSLGAQKTNFVNEHDGFLKGGKNDGFLPPSGDQLVAEVEGYQGMEAELSKDQLLWWASEFDSNNSASSNSWDSASLEMYQDFNGVGYNNINSNNQ